MRSVEKLHEDAGKRGEANVENAEEVPEQTEG
jgi:hypothetical protein